MTRPRFKINSLLSAAAVAVAGLVAAAPAQALNFVFTDIGSTPLSASQLSAFQAAANHWSSRIGDNVTVYINVGFDNLGSGVLGTAMSNFTTVDYSSLRTALVGDASSALDLQAVGSLQAGPAINFQANRPDLSQYFDNNNSTNNTLLGLTTANAKALDLVTNTNAANPDATITFANAFAGDFVYDRSGGVPASKFDFITIAQHEIGHALGFTSGVDDIDFCAGVANLCALGAEGFDSDWWAMPLDLYRYSAPGVMNLTVGGAPYFSVDGGNTSFMSFATGEFNGDGDQASHFGRSPITLMRAVIAPGEFYDATSTDLAAFDAIGWDLVTPVPEPGTWALMLLGLAAVGQRARRRG